MEYSFFLIGTGATGSQLLPMLTQLLNNTKEHNRITLIDGDVVEQKNLKNQKFLRKDVGFYKTEILAERYQRVYPNLKIKYIPEYIKNEEQLFDIIISSYSYSTIPVLIGCVDNIETRKIICSMIDKYFIKQDVGYIYLDSGNGTINRDGQIIISYNLSDDKNIKLPWDIYPEIKNSTESVDTALSCGNQTDKHPQNIATNIYAATNLFMAITNIVMFNKVNNNFIKFDANAIDVVSRTFL